MACSQEGVLHLKFRNLVLQQSGTSRLLCPTGAFRRLWILYLESSQENQKICRILRLKRRKGRLAELQMGCASGAVETGTRRQRKNIGDFFRSELAGFLTGESRKKSVDGYSVQLKVKFCMQPPDQEKS